MCTRNWQNIVLVFPYFKQQLFHFILENTYKNSFLLLACIGKERSNLTPTFCVNLFTSIKVKNYGITNKSN